MNKQVTWGQFIGSVATIAIAIFSAWGVLKTDVSNLKTSHSVIEERVKTVERDQATMEAERKIEKDKQEKYRDETLKLLYEINLKLERKQDR